MSLHLVLPLPPEVWFLWWLQVPTLQRAPAQRRDTVGADCRRDAATGDGCPSVPGSGGSAREAAPAPGPGPTTATATAAVIAAVLLVVAARHHHHHHGAIIISLCHLCVPFALHSAHGAPGFAGGGCAKGRGYIRPNFHNDDRLLFCGGGLSCGLLWARHSGPRRHAVVGAQRPRYGPLPTTPPPLIAPRAPHALPFIIVSGS
jgi:hypothetical protein